MALLIGLVLVFGIIGWLLNALILKTILKLFKVENPSTKKALLILILTWIVEVVAILVFAIIGLAGIAPILGFIVAYIVFHLLLKKYYQSGWGKSLGIYITNIIATIVLSLLIILPVRMFIVQPFSVEGASMSPTYNPGDYLLIKEFGNTYVRGDVVIFRYPKDPKQIFIKRIVGLPNETIDAKDGILQVNNEPLSAPYITKGITSVTKITLRKDEYFLIGDDPEQSLDSRIFGAVSKDKIIGKPIYTIKGLVKQ